MRQGAEEVVVIPSYVVVPLTLTSRELQQQRGHLAVVWNLATNVDFAFFQVYSICRLLHGDVDFCLRVSEDTARII